MFGSAESQTFTTLASSAFEAVNPNKSWSKTRAEPCSFCPLRMEFSPATSQPLWRRIPESRSKPSHGLWFWVSDTRVVYCFNSCLALVKWPFLLDDKNSWRLKWSRHLRSECCRSHCCWSRAPTQDLCCQWLCHHWWFWAGYRMWHPHCQWLTSFSRKPLDMIMVYLYGLCVGTWQIEV